MREITIACCTSDRTAELARQRISLDGAPYRMISIDPGSEIFYRMFQYEEFDVAEMSLSTYATTVGQGDRRFVGLPVFLSRLFRHGTLYVAQDSDISDPAQLRGRRVGTSEYEMTAGVWTRGFLADDYGVRPSDVEWVTMRQEKVPGIPYDPSIRVVREPDIDLEAALVSGHIDALAYAAIPRRLGHGIRRLFPDYAATEREYFARTRIFPIMHTLVMRRSTYEDYPWLARSLYKGFCESRERAMAHLYRAQALAFMLPDLVDAVERSRAAFGGNPWTYGLSENADALQTFTRYLVEQGLTKSELAIDDLFLPVQTSNQPAY
jgi:ABC-type nitrate/sulfonate/bicarbonate transport system substrate-binding protein